MGSGLRRNAIPQWGFARMPLSSATQPQGCHPREFRAFYSPSTPPFSLFLSRSRLGRTEREPRTDRALGLFSSVAEVPHGRPLDPPSHARPIPRNRALPHARPRSASSPTPLMPDMWKEGASNTNESGGRKINENKLLSKKNRSALPSSSLPLPLSSLLPYY